MWTQKNIVFGMGWTWIAGSKWDFSEAEQPQTLKNLMPRLSLGDNDDSKFSVEPFRMDDLKILFPG